MSLAAHAARAPAAAHSFASSILAALDDHAIVSIADIHGDIVYANQRFADISGYSVAELMGGNHRQLKSGLHPAGFYDQMWRALTEGHAWRGEICNRRKSGALYWVEASIVPMLGDDGLPHHYVSIRTDITAIKLAQEGRHQLEQALCEAQRANRAKAEFMSRMSHELRTPLNAILGFSQLLLLQKDLAAQHTDSAREIYHAGQHLLELINEVLDLSQIDLGALSLALEPLACTEAVQQALALVSAMAQEREITVSHGVDPQARVMADPLRLKQCLINLASNAIKYNRPGGRVHLGVSKQLSGTVRIEVADTGPGIAADDLSRLFQPFTRLERDRAVVEGVGIGLAITQRLIQLMGGALGVSSELGKGTVFWIELPGAPAAVPGAAAGRSTQASAVPGAKRVLYVEDNAANLKLVSSMLGMLPHIHVEGAATASEGLAAARRASPDLILLDINLPDMSGHELLVLLRREPSLAGTPVVAVSANAMPADIARGQAAGFCDYITKPFEMHLLLGRVQSLLFASR